MKIYRVLILLSALTALAETSRADAQSDLNLDSSEHSAAWNCSRAASSGKGTVTVNVRNIKRASGDIRVGLYDADSHFPDVGKYLIKAIAPAKLGAIDVTFTDVPYGRYAVAVFQDVNGNGKLEMILDLAAAEPIGFSNNARGPLLKPPSFADAAFDVASDNTAMSLDLR